jgi:hypothetical protein
LGISPLLGFVATLVVLALALALALAFALALALALAFASTFAVRGLSALGGAPSRGRGGALVSLATGVPVSIAVPPNVVPMFLGETKDVRDNTPSPKRP